MRTSELYVAQQGSGQPILFVYGSFGFGEEQWQEQLPLSSRVASRDGRRRGGGWFESTAAANFLPN